MSKTLPRDGDVASLPSPGGPAAEEFRKSDWPFYWIVRIAAVYSQIMEDALKPLGLDMPAWRVLMSLHERSPLSISHIADFCVIRLNTTTKIIQRMHAQGLVERYQSPLDRRVTEVRITARGEEARRRAYAEAERIFTTSFETIPPAEVAAMNVTLAEAFDRLRALRDPGG